MQVFLLVCLIFLGFGEAVFQLPLTIHRVPKEVIKERNDARMKKLGVKNVTELHKYDQKLLESTFSNDYITANLDIGTPKQNFNVLMASGSSRFWILDKSYQDAFPGQHRYNPISSSTSKRLAKNFYQRDGSFNVSGQYYTDIIQFIGFYVRGQAFGSIGDIVDVDDNLLFPVDGVLGLNHFVDQVYRSGKEQRALIDNLLQQVHKPLVTIYLEPYVAPSKTTTQIGYVTFGDFDHDNCNSKGGTRFTLTPSYNQYVFNIYSLEYGKDIVKKGGTVYLDSGVSNVILPADEFQNLVWWMRADYDYDVKVYTYKCGRRSDLDDVTFYWDKERKYYVTLKPDDFLLDLDLGNGYCAISFEANHGAYQQDFTLGTTFMRTVCTQYNMEENTVTFYDPK